MSKPKSKSMSRAIVLSVKADLAAGNMLQSQIAAKYNINQGRVSEVKQGKWDHL